MNTIKKTITDLNDLPVEVKNELIVTAQLSEDDGVFSEMDYFIDLIRECGDKTETSDSCYIYKEWKLETPSFAITVSGSNYLKDQCICDLEMNDEVQIENLELQKERQQSAKKQEIDFNFKKWKSIIAGLTPEELLEILKHITPPKK